MTPLEKAMSAVHANGLNEFDEDDARRFIRAFLEAAAEDERCQVIMWQACERNGFADTEIQALQAAILALKETING